MGDQCTDQPTNWAEFYEIWFGKSYKLWIWLFRSVVSWYLYNNYDRYIFDFTKAWYVIIQIRKIFLKFAVMVDMLRLQRLADTVETEYNP